MDEIMSVQECAREMQVHDDTIRKAIKRGDLKAQKMGHQFIVYRTDFEHFKENPPQIGRPPKPANTPDRADNH